MGFEIIAGDYGRSYTGKAEDVNYSDCTGKLHVWSEEDDVKTAIIDGKACVVTLVGSDTHITYDVEAGDFDVVPDVYYGMFEFIKGGVVEHTLPFEWVVIEGPP